MPVSKKLLLLGAVAIALVIVYFQVLGTKWKDVNIKYYDGKVSAARNLTPLCWQALKGAVGERHVPILAMLVRAKVQSTQ